MMLHDPETLDVLADSPHIEELSLRHFRKIHSLEPLRALKKLRVLHLSTIASWDASSRHLVVDSFEPLTALTKLERIRISAVVPKKGRLEPLERIPTLSFVFVGSGSSFYQLEDWASLSVALPKARDSLRPARPGMLCIRCKRYNKLHLKGARPRTPKFACPACDRKRLVAHLERWNDAGGIPRYDALDSVSAEDFGRLLPVVREPRDA